ncbi:MAG TPA: YbgC/FadM family acyl-CoA thioesterase [Hellea balneolensis]|uniref:YbgC/FadM family acyl-CoA thioesterase n=1 Tax=Hellea balneolensis TaxID=287478 RepID=A0A7C5LVB5_9PROT|nr:YbgC/FadM family acyl-CoA thioesterase [Hellea balneolensis]
MGYFEGRKHYYPVRVFYEDTDFTGVVFYANYLRFLERARSSFFRLAGVTHKELLERDIPLGFAIRKLNLEYLRPARIDDALLVMTSYDSYKGARLWVSQEIWRGEELLLTAHSEAACIDMNGRPRRPTKKMIELLKPFFLTD